jgi:hypothetical protein
MKNSRHCRAQLVFACLWAASAACSGEIGDPAATRGGAAANGGTRNANAAIPGNPANAAFVPAPAALRKLTVEQYQNTIHDLFGADIAVPELEPDTAQNGFVAIGAARATVSPLAAEKFETAAYAVAEAALAPAHRASFVGCTPQGTIDSACSKQFVTRFGARAFRRPLDANEVSRWVNVAESAARTLGDFHAGLTFAIAGLLQSPNFLFRVELGESDPVDATRLRYGNYAMASRLSHVLWNTTPDQALLDAASQGELVTLEGLSRQVDRMLADARLATALDDFHAERLGLADLAQLDKADSVYPGLNDALRNSLREDVLRSIAAYQDQDFRQVFDGRVAFVDAALARIYGVTPPTAAGAQRVELAASAHRAGLLGKAAFLALAAHSAETSPTLRGKFIRERVLCESIGAPPPNVVPVLGAPDPNAPTMRDRLAAHATDPVCGACHNQMDPLGLALEHFDAIGRYRADDHGHALDTRGELDGKSFDGAEALAALLHDDPRSAACVARQLYRYAVAHVESAGEQGQVDSLAQSFASSGYRFSALLRDVVLSDGFRYASKEQP